MISIQKLLQSTRKGFSLIEVVIVISIIGVLSSVAVPTCRYFIKEKEELEVENTSLIIKDDILSFLAAYQDGNSGYEYPIVGVQSTQTNGTTNYLNITNSQFIRHTQSLVNNISLYDYSKDYDRYEIEVGNGFISQKLNVNVIIFFKNKQKLIFKYTVSDNQSSYKDMAYLKSFIFYNEDGLSFEQIM